MKYNINQSILVYICFLMGYMLQISYLSTQYNNFKILEIICFVIGYILGIVKLLHQKWNQYSFRVVIILIFIGLMVFLFNDQIGIEARIAVLNLFWVIICSKNNDFDKLITVDLFIKIYFTIISFILCQIGVLTNVTNRRLGSFIDRYAFGYDHANYLGAVMFLIGIYLMYIRRKKLNVLDLIIQVAILVFNYRVTTSKTSMIGNIFVIVYILYNVVMRKIKHRMIQNFLQWCRKYIKYVPIILILIMFGLSLCFDYNSSSIIFLNKILTSRLEQGMKVLTYYSPTLFGTNITRLSWGDALSGGYDTALVGSDIVFFYIYTTFGIVTLIAYIYIIVYCVNYSYKIDYCMLYCVIVIMLMSCMENQYMNIGSNAFLMIFQTKIYRDKISKI